MAVGEEGAENENIFNKNEQLNCMKECWIPARELFSIFLGPQSQLPIEVPPSLFMIELKRSQDERQQLLKRHKALERNREFKGELDISPSVIVFQNWLVNKTYNVKFTIANRLKNPLDVTVVCEGSPNFSIGQSNNARHCKLVNGITTPFSVTFRPDALKDYRHRVVIKTFYRKIIVPVLAIGPRPILDFPDKIDLGEVPVLVFTERLLSISNVGDAQAAVTLSTESPFEVFPYTANILPSKSIPVKIMFRSFRSGLFYGTLKVNFDSGDEMVVQLVSIAVTANVWLQTESVDFAPTFIGTETEYSLKVHNETDHVLAFKWLKYPCSDHDVRIVLNLKTVQKQAEHGRLGVDFFANDNNHDVVMNRVHADCTDQVLRNNLAFYHDAFNIAQLEGKVAPHSEAVVYISFKPEEARFYSAKAYCEIEGADRRFQLEIRGTGVGPDIETTFDVIDLDVIFLKLEHCVEVIFTNMGVIPGMIRFRHSDSVTGCILTSTPSELCIPPTESRILVVRFISDTIGPFVEDLFFDIVGTDKFIRIIVKGKTVSPLLVFDQSSLDFGRIPIGFPISHRIRAENKSPIAVTFHMTVKDDGDIPSLPAWAFNEKSAYSAHSVFEGEKKVQEFRLLPSSGVLMPHAHMDIEVMLTPSQARECSTSIKVCLQGIEYDEMTIPVHFIASGANLQANPSHIIHRFAFIDMPYYFDLSIENQAETAVFYLGVKQEVYEQCGIVYKLLEPYGVVNAHSSKTVKLEVIVTRLGEHTEPVYVQIFGSQMKLPLCDIIVRGIGPLVTVDPYVLRWKDQPIAVPSTKEVTLSNICPIPAVWRMWMESKAGGDDCDPQLWSISPESGVLEPGEDAVVEVTACLVDPKKVRAELILDVDYSVNTTVKVFGNGVGSSVMFEPPIMDKTWDFGDVFMYEKSEYPIMLKNIGTFHYTMIFTQKKLKTSERTVTKEESAPIEFNPRRFDLEGCENREMKVVLQSDQMGERVVEYYLYAILNRKGRRLLIAHTNLKANFIFPLLMVEPRILTMYIRLEILTMDLPAYLTAESTVWTSTLVPVHTVCSTKQPFSLLFRDGDCGTKFVFEVTKEPVSTLVKLNLVDLDEDEMKNISGVLTYTVMNKYQTRVPIKAAVLFPYVTVNESTVNLGSSEPYVELCSKLHLKNSGNLQVKYQWKFIVESFKFTDVREMSFLQLEPEELAKIGTGKLETLPNWTPKDSTYGMSPEDVVIVNSASVVPRMGVLSALAKSQSPQDEIQVRDNDVVNINTRAIVGALCPILNQTVARSFITRDKQDMPLQPYKDGREWDLDIVPSYGSLSPQHHELTYAFFEPDRMGVYSGDGVCQVEDGLSRTVTFYAACGPAFFRVEPKMINFGARKFCELWRFKFEIVNVGWTSFYYEINILRKDHLLEYSLVPRTFSVNPSSKLVLAGTSQEIELTFYPGVTGPLERYFLLSIGSLPFTKVHMKGLATMPQIEVQSSLDNCDQVPEEIIYNAIGRQLCNEWFDPGFYKVKSAIGPRGDEHICLEIPPLAMAELEFLHPFEEGWVIITNQDYVPQQSDINLAVERELCYDYYHYLPGRMKQHTLLHDIKEKKKSLPYFFTPGYKMDVGPVVIGNEAFYDLVVRNPGPLDVDFKIRLPFKNKAYLAKKGITFDYDEVGHMAVNDLMTIRSAVRPTRKLYKNMDADCSIEFVFYIEVACGAKVPVRFNTVITVPYLNMKKSLDFGTIKCGQKKLAKFIIKNSGLVHVNWHCKLREVKRKKPKQVENSPKHFDKQDDAPFTVWPDEGTLDPLNYQFLTIEFIPTSGGRFSRLLEFHIQDREKPQCVRLTGQAIEPKVDIQFEDMDFGYTTPFARNKSKDLVVTNNSPIPLEVFFPEYDYDIFEEEKIFTMLCHYYGVPNVFIPHTFYGTSMTSDLRDIYYVQLGGLAEEWYWQDFDAKMKAIQLEHTRKKTAESGATNSMDKDNTAKTPKSKKKKKEKSSTQSVEAAETQLSPQETRKSETNKSETPLITTPEPSLEEKILAYLSYLATNPEIPRKDLFHPEKYETEYEEAKRNANKLIFFGGGPNTNYKYWAKHLAKATNLLYTTVDELILFAAATSNSGSAAAVRKAVNNAYIRVVMGLDPNLYELPDQLSPYSEIADPLLDLLMKVTDIGKVVEERIEALRKLMMEEALKSKLSPEKSGISKAGRKSKASGSRRQSKRASKSEGRKSKTAGSKRASQAGKRASQAGKRASKSAGGKRASQAGKRASQAGKRASQAGKRASKSAGGKRASQASKRTSRAGSMSSKGTPKKKKASHEQENLDAFKLIGGPQDLDIEKPIFEDLLIDDLLDLIKDYLLKYVKHPGIVLDYVRGFFIRDSVLAMKTVLKAVWRSMCKMTCVDINNSYGFYDVILENRRKAEEKREQEELIRKLNEIDQMNGFKFAELDEPTKMFYIERVKQRDQMINDMNGIQPAPQPKPAKSAKSKSAPASNGTETPQTASRPPTTRSGLFPEEEDLERKNSTALIAESYLAKLNYKFYQEGQVLDEFMLKWCMTYDKEMQEIRNIVENWNSSKPFWEKDAPVGQTPLSAEKENKKTTKKNKKDQEKEKERDKDKANEENSSRKPQSATTKDTERKVSKEGSDRKLKGLSKVSATSSSKRLTLKADIGFPLYVLHTMPYGQEKEVAPFMDYLCNMRELHGLRPSLKSWDDVDLPEPVTYFWLMQPLTAAFHEDIYEDATLEELSASLLKSPDETPDITTSSPARLRHFVGTGGPGTGAKIYAVKSESKLRTERSDISVRTATEPEETSELSPEDDTEGLDVRELKATDFLKRRYNRRREVADPMMMGLMNTSNIANESICIEQLKAEFLRMNPLLKPYLNYYIELLLKLNLKLYEDTGRQLLDELKKKTYMAITNFFRRQVNKVKRERTSKSSARSVFRSAMSVRRSVRDEDDDDQEEEDEEDEDDDDDDDDIISIPELVEVEQFNILGVNVEVGGEESGPGPRVLLQPGESVTWRVMCGTRKCGHLERKYLLEIGGWPKSLVPITCHVISGIPTINTDYKCMYSRVDKVQDKIYPSYDSENQHVDFGSILCSQNQRDPKVFQVGDVIKFYNNSEVMIEELYFSWDEDDQREKGDFSFEPALYENIKPGEERLLHVFAHPTSRALGDCNAAIWWSIKNNPEIGMINLKCKAIGARLNFNPENFTKNKVLLFRDIRRSLFITNPSTRALRWELVNILELKQAEIRLTQSKGLIRKGQEVDVVLSYMAKKPGFFATKLQIAVYSHDRKGDPLQVENIRFDADGTDVVVDIVYTWKSPQLLPRGGINTDKDNVNFGRSRVEDVIKRSFFIVNESNTDIYFEIEPHRKLLYSLEVKPMKGRLVPGKKEEIECTVTVTIPCHLKKENFLDILIYCYNKDREREDVATLPIPMSLLCVKSKFIFYPSPELDFGVIETTTVHNEEIVFENQGDMPVDVAIMTDRQLQLLVWQLMEVKKQKEEERRTGKRKRRSSHRNSAPLALVTSKGSKGSKSAGSPVSRGSSEGASKSSRARSKSKSRGSVSKERRKSKSRSKSVGGRSKSTVGRTKSIGGRTKSIGGRTKSKSLVNAPSVKSTGSKRSKSRSRDRQDILTFLDRRPFEIGPFKVSNNGITVPANGKATITVTCDMRYKGQAEELLVICPPEIMKDHPERGSFYPLKAFGSAPTIDFKSFGSMFPDMKVVGSGDPIDLSDGEPFVVYNKDTNTITFYNVALSQHVSKTINLTNVGFLDVALDVNIRETPSEVNQEKSFGFDDELKTSDKTLFVPKFTNGTMKIFFSPSALQKVTGTMRFSIQSNVKGHRTTYSVKLEGQGTLPEITVLRPPPTNPTTAVLDFGNCALNADTPANITFKNTGKIVCTVLVEMMNEGHNDPNPRKNFFLKASDAVKSKYLLARNLPDPQGQSLGPSSKFFLPRGDEVTLEAIFNPTTLNEVYSGRILLHAIYNPYVINTVILTGTGSVNWLCLKGVPLVMPQRVEVESKDEGEAEIKKKSFKGRQSTSGKRQSAVGGKKPASSPSEKVGSPSIKGTTPVMNSMYYEMDFGTVPTGVIHTYPFELSNTLNEPCKYSWESLPTVRVIPSVGHILSKMSKKFYAVFTSEEPVELKLDMLTCTAYPIDYGEDNPTVNWDNQTKTVQWINNMDDSTLISTKEFLEKQEFFYPEPKHTKVGTADNEKTILLAVRGKTVTPEIAVADRSINMNTSFLYQKEEAVTEITNKCDIPVEFTWNIRTTGVEASQIFSNHPAISLGPLGDGEYPGIVTAAIEDDDMPPPSRKGRTLPERSGYLYRPGLPMEAAQRRVGERDYCPSYSISAHPSATFELSDYSNVFTVSPWQGVIPPNETMSFKFTFTPPEPLQYSAVANLHVKGMPGEKTISLTGVGQISACHLEVTPSDYLTAGRRILDSYNMHDYDPKTTVIELRVLGIGVVNRKRFVMMNPTEYDYHYQWQAKRFYGEADSKNRQDEAFLCCTKFGKIGARKREQMIFEFRPKHSGTFESPWLLEIPEMKLEHLVLFVGIVTNPKVDIKPSVLNLRATCKGLMTSGQVNIENGEDIPLQYNFQENTLLSVSDRLEVTPISGTVKPHESSPVHYVPQMPGEETFRVKCNVKRLSAPLELTVRTVCYLVEPVIKYKYNNKIENLTPFSKNAIQLGRTYERIPCDVEFILLNSGTAPWYFHCVPDTSMNEFYGLSMSLSAESGLVLSKQSASFTLSITATKKVSFQDLPFCIKIIKGPDFRIHLSGSAAHPEYELNFHKYDFGPKLVLEQPNYEAYSTELRITNLEDFPFVIIKTSEDPAFLYVDLLSCIIEPRSTLVVPISFCPLDEGAKEAEVKLIINDMKEEIIHIKGEGVELDLQLRNARDELIDFGTVPVNETAKKEVEILNASKCSNNVHLTIANKEGFISRVHPKTFEIPPKNSVKVEISLSPVKRGIFFERDVKYRVRDKVNSLLTIKCMGGGHFLTLNRPHIPFPALAIGSSMVDQVCLVNKGEFATTFEWKIEPHCRELFNIAPLSGNSNPGSSIPFEVTFYPTKLFKNIRKQAVCVLGCGDKLTLDMSGACVELPLTKEYINFEVPVRQKISKKITLENPTYAPWKVFPVMSGLYFSGADKIYVEPGEKVTYEIVYHPMTSTKREKHTGSLFLALPNGTNALYSFVGSASPPLEEACLTWVVQAKEETKKTIEVNNWSNEPQRLKVSFARTDGGDPEMFVVQGSEYLDLPPKCNKTHSYDVTVYAFQEGPSVWRVEMINKRTEEMMVYKVWIKVVGHKVLESFTMETTLRVPVVKGLILENPSTRPAEVNFEPPTTALTLLNELPIIIPANDSLIVRLEYLPLALPVEAHPEEATEEEIEGERESLISQKFRTESHSLEFLSPQLGTFHFKVDLIAHDALPEPPIYVEAHISSPTVFLVPIRVFTTKHTDKGSLSNGSFEFHSNFQDIWLLENEMDRVGRKHGLSAKCIYSPSQLGRFNCMLTFHSHEAGTYKFPIVATGLPPKPLGPIIFETGEFKSIAFQNIFPESQTFKVQCSNTAFSVEGDVFKLDPNEVKVIGIKMVWAHRKPENEEVFEAFPVATLMTVVPEDPSRPGISWTFYLRGTNREISSGDLSEESTEEARQSGRIPSVRRTPTIL